MVKHVTEIQSITSPIIKAKFAEALDNHIKTISEIIYEVANKGGVQVKFILTEHPSNFKLDEVIPEYNSCDGCTVEVHKFMQMKLSNALADLFTDQGYGYCRYDVDINGFNVKHIIISWWEGLVTE